MRVSNAIELPDLLNMNSKNNNYDILEIPSQFPEFNKLDVAPAVHNKQKVHDEHQQNSKNSSDNKLHEISFGRRRQLFTPDGENAKFWKWKREDKNYYQNRAGKAPAFSKNLRDASEFRYGNYHQYYGYRNKGHIDSRLHCMKHEWFSGKDVLDIGCNAGHFTLSIARDFSPKSVIGVDIDHDLVKMAMRNVRHYVRHENISNDDFPISLPLSYGPVAQAFDHKNRYPPGNFPFNVQFLQGNYILPSDEMLEWQEPAFDTVLCLSLTKWIHLNFGDVGIKRLFHRIHAQLHPGGYLILEAQAFQSYARKKKITEELNKNYNQIQLFPEMFNEYLLKEVGFQSCELIDTPAHSSKGFSRPIYLFTKAKDPETEKKQKHIFYSYSSDSCCEYSDVEQLSD